MYSYFISSDSEREDREAVSEAVPEPGEDEAAAAALEGREAESEVETTEPSSGADQPGAMEPSTAAEPGSVPSNPADSGAADPADLPAGGSTTAMELGRLSKP